MFIIWLCGGGGNAVGSDVGCIVGVNNEMVSKCYNKDGENASCYRIVGGNRTDGTIEFCYNEFGDSKDAAGRSGIAFSNSGVIKSCYNLGDITGYISSSGIVVHNNETGIIINCYNKGDITCTNYGSCAIAVTNNGLIVGCYNEGKIYLHTYSLCRYNYGYIISCYNISMENDISLCDSNSGTIIGCYNVSNGGKVTYSNTGTVSKSYYYDATNSVICDETGIEITESLVDLLQAANDELSSEEDYETKKVTWTVDINKNNGYPAFEN